MKIYRNLNKTEDILVRKVLKNYDFGIGKIEIQKNLVANINDVYLIKDGKRKFILRQSQKDKQLNHLKLEIQLLRYFQKKNFKLTPYSIPNKNGDYITVFENKYYILLNFMPGEIKASWNNLTRFNENKLVGFFQASAYFTKAARQFKSSIKFENRPLYSYIKNGQSLFNGKLKKIQNSRIKKLLNQNKDFISQFILQNKKELDEIEYDQSSRQLVHFDFHPGNVNFIGNEVSGIFDFDWIRFDNRISDLAGTIGQSCYRYRGINSGLYNKKRIQIGLKVYRKVFGKAEIGVKEENRMVKTALKAYMFFQLIWCMDWYTRNRLDPKAYEYINFFVKVLRLNDFDWLFDL